MVRRRFIAVLAGTLFTALPFAVRAEPAQMKEQSSVQGVEAQSADGRHSVAFGGFAQVRYTTELDPGEPPRADLLVPRTRLYTFGRIYAPEIRYRLMLGTPPDSIDVKLWDAYVEWGPLDAVRLRAGRFKVPVLRQWVESARLLASTERSGPVRTVLPGRDDGLLLSGELASRHIEYAAGLFAGPGDARAGSVRAPAAAGRLLWNVTGRAIEGEVDFRGTPTAVVVGASALATTSRHGAPGESLGGVEATLRRRGLDVSAEGYTRGRNGGPRQVGADLRVHRYVPCLRSGFGVRAARLVDLHRRTGSRTEIELGAATYLEQHDLKVGLALGAQHLGDWTRWGRYGVAQVQVAF